MKRTLSPQHTSFFNNNGFLELEDLLSEKDADELLKRIHEIPSPSQRDLWQKDPWIRSLSMNKGFSHIAKELFQKRSLRLAFDQHLHTSNQTDSPFKDVHTLNSCCSFQSLQGGLIIRLTQTPNSVESTDPFCPLPGKKGCGIYFSANLPLDWEKLSTLPNESLWLIAYCPINTIYIHNPSDPLTNFLKNEAYGFGDHLRDDRHPILK